MLYAIGEIALVVIGILIALQINNWNENNKNENEVKNALVELNADLEYDLNIINDVITRIERADIASVDLLNKLKKPKDSIDLVALFHNIFSSQALGVFGSTDVAYNNLLAQGNIDLIKNSDLKRDLGSYHNKFNWDATYANGPLLKSLEDFISNSYEFTQPGAMRNAYEAYYPRRDSLKIQALRRTKGEDLINYGKLENISEFLVILDRFQTNRYLQKTLHILKKEEIESLIEQINLEIEIH